MHKFHATQFGALKIMVEAGSLIGPFLFVLLNILVVFLATFVGHALGLVFLRPQNPFWDLFILGGAAPAVILCARPLYWSILLAAEGFMMALGRNGINGQSGAQVRCDFIALCSRKNV